jgi:hypothetical protein
MGVPRESITTHLVPVVPTSRPRKSGKTADMTAL